MTAWDAACMMWKRPLGPCGLSEWSVTLAISGKSRLATTRIDEALLVQEICSPKYALLLLTSVQPSTSSSIVSLKKRRQKSTALAVGARLGPGDGRQPGEHAAHAHRLVDDLDPGELLVLQRQRLGEVVVERLDEGALANHRYRLGRGVGPPGCERRPGGGHRGGQELTAGTHGGLPSRDQGRGASMAANVGEPGRPVKLWLPWWLPWLWLPWPTPGPLRAHRVRGRPRLPQRRRQVGELAEERPRVARVDDLLDPEGLGRAEGRAELRQAFLDLGELPLRIRGRVEVGPVGRLDPALERERAPAAGGPGVARAVAAAVPVGRAGDPEHVADDHRAPRDRRLPDRGHRADALLDRAGPLGLLADEEAGAVDEIDDGQVEGLREVHEALDLLAGVRGPGAAVEERIARHQRHGPAVEAREAGDHRAAVERPEREERAPVDDRLDDRAHLVRLADVVRDRAEEPGLAAPGVVAAGPAWR